MRRWQDTIFGRAAWRRGFSMLGIALSVGMVVAGCGPSASTTTNNGGGNLVQCPDTTGLNLVNPGQLTIATDNTYAPAEYVDPTSGNQFAGYDMDLAREFANRLCLQTNIEKATFDDIIPKISTPSLGQQPWDMSISSFTITTERQQKVDMIPYFQAGESILTLKADPKNIKAIADMCGKIIGVQNGTVEQDELNDANGHGPGTSGQSPVCQSNPITLVGDDDQSVVVQDVLNGRVDASYQDQPVTDYYANLNSGKLIDSGITVQPSPEGIVVRKDNAAFETAIKNALAAMRADGTYKQILTKWGVQNLAYPKL